MRLPKLWIRTGGTIIAVVVAVACASTAGRAALSGHSAGPGASSGRSSDSRSTPAAGAGSASPGTVSAQVGSNGVTALPRLTARQRAGQRVIYSYHGLTPPAGLLKLIRHGEAAGVIFFGPNISSLAQIGAVVQELEHANASALNPVRLPLLLMTDQEGGLVRRLPGAPALSEKQIGASAHPAAEATSAGIGAGENLRGVGMNVNLAPVLDVYRKPGDFIDQFGRSYSRNPHKVSYLGADFIKAQQGKGVAATAKHFPGLGAAATSQDTDVKPVTLNLSKATIRNVDELPYKAAIRAKVKLIMVSWAVYPALDPKRPAGLSSVIVQGELRQRLGFGGVTITDALEAGALRAFGVISNRSVLAAQAGMDLILCAGQNVTEGNEAVGGLETGYRDGALSHAAFKASLRRVLALRASLPS